MNSDDYTSEIDSSDISEQRSISSDGYDSESENISLAKLVQKEGQLKYKKTNNNRNYRPAQGGASESNFPQLSISVSKVPLKGPL